MKRQDKADEYYLEARNAVIDAVGALPKRIRSLRLPDGTRFRVNRKPPLRIYLLMIYRHDPGKSFVSFNFQRNGRVNLGGERGIPLGDAIAAGHEPWASRDELLELATQIRRATAA